jgi:hypothetical protein
MNRLLLPTKNIFNVTNKLLFRNYSTRNNLSERIHTKRINMNNIEKKEPDDKGLYIFMYFVTTSMMCGVGTFGNVFISNIYDEKSNLKRYNNDIMKHYHKLLGFLIGNIGYSFFCSVTAAIIGPFVIPFVLPYFGILKIIDYFD